MPIMRRVVLAVCLVVVTAAAAGCADPGTRPGGSPTTAATWGNFELEVAGVTSGPGARSVTITVRAPTGCRRNLAVTNTTEENGNVFANVVGDVLDPPPPAGCPSPDGPTTTTLTAKQAIGNRPLVLNQQAWALRNGTYRTCDQNLGCHPPADHCDPVWVRAAVRGLDVSRHSQGDVAGCDAHWLVMTVPDDPAACGAEARPGCTSTTAVRRYFLSWTGTGWEVVATTTDGGCTAVLKAAPAFPRKLCSAAGATKPLTTSGAPIPPSSGAPPGG
jgi:hypothetical protein